MHLYEIALPVCDNSGYDMGLAHAEFQLYLMAVAGGWTRMPAANGAWRDPDTAQVYHDQMTAYRFATDHYETKDLVVKHAFNLFPDQLAIFVSHIGEAEITPNPSPVRDTKTALWQQAANARLAERARLNCPW